MIEQMRKYSGLMIVILVIVFISFFFMDTRSMQGLAGAPSVVVQAAPAQSVPAPSVPGYSVVQKQEAASCPGRLLCRQIGSCQEAQFYLANCSWGHKLDSDTDGVPCESICR